MKRLFSISIGALGVCAHLLAQTVTPRAAVPELVLTGIVELPPAAHGAPASKRVFLETVTGSSVACYSLVEGERKGDFEILLVNSSDGKVTLRFRGKIVELSFGDQSRRVAAVRLAEQQKDASHTQYHTVRAKLDRERDAAQRRP
jgi:hypothetical protein